MYVGVWHHIDSPGRDKGKDEHLQHPHQQLSRKREVDLRLQSETFLNVGVWISIRLACSSESAPFDSRVYCQSKKRRTDNIQASEPSGAKVELKQLKRGTVPSIVYVQLCVSVYLCGQVGPPQHEAQRAARQHSDHRQRQQPVPPTEVPDAPPEFPLHGPLQQPPQSGPHSVPHVPVGVSRDTRAVLGARLLLAARQQQLVHGGQVSTRSSCRRVWQRDNRSRTVKDGLTFSGWGLAPRGPSRALCGRLLEVHSRNSSARL